MGKWKNYIKNFYSVLVLVWPAQKTQSLIIGNKKAMFVTREEVWPVNPYSPGGRNSCLVNRVGVTGGPALVVCFGSRRLWSFQVGLWHCGLDHWASQYLWGCQVEDAYHDKFWLHIFLTHLWLLHFHHCTEYHHLCNFVYMAPSAEICFTSTWFISIQKRKNRRWSHNDAKVSRFYISSVGIKHNELVFAKPVRHNECTVFWLKLRSARVNIQCISNGTAYLHTCTTLWSKIRTCVSKIALSHNPSVWMRTQ